MRVLAVGNLYPPHDLGGGVEVVWRGLMRHLRARGDDVRVLTTDFRRRSLPAGAAEDPGVYRELAWYWREHDWPRIGALARLRLERRNADVFDRHLAEFQPDVINWWGVGGMSLSLIERARRAGVPAVLFVHDYWPSYGPSRDLWTRMWSARPRAGAVAERLTGIPTHLELGNAGRWLFNSSTVEEEALRTGIRISDRAILAPGVEDYYLRVPRERQGTEWRWRLLYVGRIVEQKGVDLAIESLPQLPAEAMLTIVGEGGQLYERELRQLAQKLGVSGRVQFTRTRPHNELIDLYRSADVIVFPVRWPEPFGLVPLEAMALGRPVVATGAGGSADYLVDGVNSLLFAADDATGLAATLQQLARDPQLRTRLREAGYATAAQHSARAFNERALAEIQAIVSPKAPRSLR
jgi:glycosyltransferase involved in cell wall biosynthesis